MTGCTLRNRSPAQSGEALMRSSRAPSGFLPSDFMRRSPRTWPVQLSNPVDRVRQCPYARKFLREKFSIYLPKSLDEVLERAKDIQYSSKTRFNTKQVQELEGFWLAMGRLLRKLPAALRDDPDYKLLQPLSECKRHITIAHLINRHLASSANSKDFEFCRTTVRKLWQEGLDDVRRTVSYRAWLNARKIVDGMRVFDLAG
jgi:NTE family protein